MQVNKILEQWDQIEQIHINSDGYKNKQAYIRRMKSVSTTKSKVPLHSGELTQSEIKQIQERILRNKHEKTKHKFIVPLHNDYEAKMQEELYSTTKRSNISQSNKVTQQKNKSNKGSNQQRMKASKSDFWSDFDTQDKASNIQAKSKNKDAFEFDFDNYPKSSKDTSKRSSHQSDFDDIFTKSKNQPKVAKKNDWFDDFETKPKSSRKVQNKADNFIDSKKNKKQTGAFEFDFDQPYDKAQDKNEINYKQPKHEVLNQEQEYEDLLFADEKIEKDTNLLFSDDKAQEKNWLFGDTDDDAYDINDDLIDTNPKTTSDNLFDDYFAINDQKPTKKDNSLIQNLTRLYSANSSNQEYVEDKDILKPKVPEVLKKQRQFVPEVKEVGQQFWENLYGPQIITPEPTANTYFTNNSSMFEAKSNAPISKPTFEFQPQNVTNSSNKAKKQEDSNKSFNFTRMGTNYLLQTNVKNS